MEDIKSLYLQAARPGGATKKVVDAYTEAVNQLLESDPNGYVANAEYIISSSIGAKTVKPFVEKWGLPIIFYEQLMETLDHKINHGATMGKDATALTEAREYLETYMSRYPNAINAYHYMNPLPIDQYLHTYYTINPSGVQNRKLAVGMLKRFGESVIPDMFITAANLPTDAERHNGIAALTNYLNESYSCRRYRNAQILNECTSDIGILGSVWPTLHDVVGAIKDEHDNMIRESVIAGDDDASIEYTVEDVESILEYIKFLEFKMCGAGDGAKAIYDEVMDLYSRIDGYVTESGEIIQPSEVEDITEDMHLNNTTNKKTGAIPAYLRQNHDLAYGEDDSVGSKPKSDENESPEYKDIADQYMRPSASSKDADTSNDGSDDAGVTPADNPSSPVNNYYYYTYHDSFNKNSNSFNKDHSVKTANHDNSRINNDNSVVRNTNTTDRSDHSTGKHIHSDNRYTAIKDENLDDDDDESHGETDKPKDKTESSAEVAMMTPDNPDEITESPDEPDRPESDHPVKDAMMDIDRNLVKHQQNAKRAVQNVQNAGRAVTKPFKRAAGWITNVITDWKDKGENEMKEKMVDPHARNTLFEAIRASIIGGSLLKAGLLLNPVFLFLGGATMIGNHQKKSRIRDEIIGELKTEIKIIDKKIEDADRSDRDEDRKAKYQLMRLKNEIQKKLIRVGGTPTLQKII